MAYLGVVILVGVTTIALAILANTRFRHESRLPMQSRLSMQWWLDGRATWTAPRLVALAMAWRKCPPDAPVVRLCNHSDV